MKAVMKGSMDLRSAVFAAIDEIQKPGREADAEGQQNTECRQLPQDKEPNLPKGYSPIRDGDPGLTDIGRPQPSSRKE